MPFLLMIFLTLVALPRVDDWKQPSWIGSVELSASLTWVSVLITAGYALFLSRRVCRPGALRFENRERTLRRYERGRAAHQLVLLTLFGLSIWIGGWGWAVRQFYGRFSGGTLWPGADLMVLAPFFAALLLSWTFLYDADRAAFLALTRPLDDSEPARPFSPRFSYVSYQLRQKFVLVLLPVVLLLIRKEIDLRLGTGDEGFSGYISHGLDFAIVLMVFVGMPWIVRIMLGLRPMPAGPLRDRLLATSRRLGYPCSELLVWDSRSGMVNAMVVGILPWLRYVIFTDRLLVEFSPEEVEAVLGHELGHVKHHHMLTYMVFLSLSMTVLWGATEGLFELLHQLIPDWDLGESWFSETIPEYHKALPMLLALLAYIYIVFGFLSRRCERQADIFGCRAVSCGAAECLGHEPEQSLDLPARALCPTGIGIFIHALEKVALLNGLNREKPGFLQWWQHGTIAQRVSFLERLKADPGVGPRFQRNVPPGTRGPVRGIGGGVSVDVYDDELKIPVTFGPHPMRHKPIKTTALSTQ